MNWRKSICLSYATTRGYRFPSLLEKYLHEHAYGMERDATTVALRRLLRHCKNSVPYYAEWLPRADEQIEHGDPRELLRSLPILTKQDIRANSDKLQSADLAQRRWHYNTSGGSTGEPVQFIQDAAYDDSSAALAHFYNFLLGCEVGDPLIRLWGSERDLEGAQSRKARFFNWLSNTIWLNAFEMSSQRMREFVETFNRVRPRLIIAYAQAIYELARFVERERLSVTPQRTIVTSAGTLHPFMREKISQVFGCAVYNLYGSREVSDIACELPGEQGLWVAPWNNFVEIVDAAGQPVPSGTEGNIVVTCLTNCAMPLLRYAIGDRGSLLPEFSRGAQSLERVSGRSVDAFRTPDGTLVDGEYFTHLLYFRPWIAKFQVIQRGYAQVLFRIVRFNGAPAHAELDEIIARTRRVMGADCQVEFEFADEIPPHASGKFRYTISEVSAENSPAHAGPKNVISP